MSDKVKTNSELEKYRNNDIVKKLNLTDSEFRKYIFIIKQMIDADPSSDYISELTRINGKLEVRTIIAEKTVRRLRIKNNYLIRSFSDMDLEVSLTKEYFSKVDATKAKLLDWYKNYLKQNNNSHGIYVYGAMGIGKTFTSIAFANELANKNHTIAFIFLPEMVMKLMQGFNPDSGIDGNDFMNKMQNADFLFLDDLGAEKTNQWFYERNLLIILNHRMEHRKPTFFNSNFSLEQFEKKLIALMHNSQEAHRLIERIRTLTKKEQFEIKGTNKRY